MAKANSTLPETTQNGNATAMPDLCAHGQQIATRHLHLVALARWMGRQAAADAIRAGAMPASNYPPKETSS
jgi:hypothetical protein